MKAIICVDQIEFNNINNTIQSWLLQNVSNYNAQKWAEALIHPEDGRIAIIVEDRIFDSLNQSQKDRIIELAEDWFSTQEI
jgi:hypothetical protein